MTCAAGHGREGNPVRHCGFPGNAVDLSTVAKVKHDSKGWRLNRCVCSSAMRGWSRCGTCVRWRAGAGATSCACGASREEVDTEVVSWRGRYCEVAENLRVNHNFRFVVNDLTWPNTQLTNVLDFDGRYS